MADGVPSVVIYETAAGYLLDPETVPADGKAFISIGVLQRLLVEASPTLIGRFRWRCPPQVAAAALVKAIEESEPADPPDYCRPDAGDIDDPVGDDEH